MSPTEESQAIPISFLDLPDENAEGEEEAPERLPIAIHSRNVDLSRIVRNLLLLYPITRLETEKSRLGGDASLFAGVDTLYLSFAMFDYISECMVLDSGALREGIVEHLAEAVARLKPEEELSNRRRVAGIVLDQLSNSRENHRTFQFPYFDAAEDALRNREFRLIFLRVGEDNEGRYYLTPEGFAAYLSLLELDNKISQEMDEYLIRRLMDRGEFDDALRIAKRSRKRTIELKDRLNRSLFRIRREIHNVSWNREVGPFIDESRSHLNDRIEEEGNLLEKLSHYLEGVKTEQRAHLIHIQETLEECQGHHRALHQEIMDFNAQFLEAQSRAYRAPRISGLANLEDEILARLVHADVDRLGEVAPEITAILNVPKIPKLFDPLHLLTIIDSLDVELGAEKKEEKEMDLIPEPMDRFDRELIVEMTRYLLSLLESTDRLSLQEIILQMERDQLNSDQTLCGIYLVMQWYGDGQELPGYIIRKEGKLMQGEAASGDNLMISKEIHD